jgi:hypothetical protein
MKTDINPNGTNPLISSFNCGTTSTTSFQLTYFYDMGWSGSASPLNPENFYWIDDDPSLISL